MQPGSKLLRLLVALALGPTPLNGGRRLLPGRCVWLEASWGRPVKCNEFLYWVAPDASGMSAGA